MERKTEITITNKTGLQVFEVPASPLSITRWLERMNDLRQYTLLLAKKQGAYHGKYFIDRKESNGSLSTC